MRKGSLDKMINDSRHSLAPPQYTSTAKYIILLGIALSMKYLHSKSIIHRDLKPGNVLLDDVLHPHICDFGCSKVSDKKLKDIIMKSEIGTPAYMAPEIFSGDHYNYKVDIYAYSIIFYEVISDEHPYNIKGNTFTLIEKVLEGKRPNISSITNKSIHSFLKSCWSSDPYDRPTFSQVVDFLIQEKIRDFFDADYEEVDDFLANFEDELKSSESYTALDVKMEADGGSIEAMMQYGRMLIDGIGTEIDFEEGIRYYKMAGDLGSVRSMFNVGYLMSIHPEIENNIEESIKYYEKAVENGSVDAAFNLGVMYHDGIKVETDFVKSAYYLKFAADAGSDTAQYNYGYMLLHGERFPVNKKEAAKYFKMSAENGNVDSMNLLAYMLQEGEGVEVDKEEAGRLYKKSADKGNVDGMFNYGQMRKFGDEIKMDKKEAAKYLKMSADLGSVDASYQYADMLYDGDGIDVDLDEAAKYLKKPVEEGRSEALFLYGSVLHKKNGFGEFSKESIYYIKRAADLGNIDAAFNYSTILYAKNKLEDFKKYLKIAAYGGNAQAMFMYGSMYNDKEYLRKAAEKGINNENDILNNLYKTYNIDEQTFQDKLNELKSKNSSQNNHHNVDEETEGIFQMGVQYDEGIYYPMNKELAAKYYKIAADKGHDESMYLYARLLRHGEGVPLDINESIKYYKLASNLGNSRAMINLGHIYKQGENVPVNLKEAARFYKMAVDHGNTNAKFMYGQCLFLGEGIQQDVDKGLFYIKKAEEEGCELAKEFLKFYNNREDSIEKKEIELQLGHAKYLYEENNYNDRIKASNIFKKVADNYRSEEGMMWYAKMCLNGDGIPKNINEAITYFEKAVNYGNVEAMKILGGLMLQMNKNEDSFRYLRMAANNGDLISSFLIKKLFK